MLYRYLKGIINRIRSIIRWFLSHLIAVQTLSHLQSIREFELSVIIKLLPEKGRLLEIGSGTGWQASALTEKGFDVSAMDINTSNYYEERVFPVEDYDGHNLPFENAEFDIVYTSNLLEHVPHVRSFQDEIHRVLKPNGLVIHVLPSSSWRFWTNITHFIKYLNVPCVHGEYSENAFIEIARFSRSTWRQLFNETGWKVISEQSNDLFYTGCSVLDSRVSINARSKLNSILGSSCNIFVLKKSMTV
ncbi:class I SAM-dependent methyltransferase [Solemya velesiana gill symbiont]|nr:class I SAM-dependent methyltransferase [Solemya velesiana gill symbiont]